MPGKYPSKGMNKLAEERPDVARKIMGYQSGGMNDPEARQERLKKAMDLNNDGVVTKQEQEAFEKTLMQDFTGSKPQEIDAKSVEEFKKNKKKDGGMVRKYGHGGEVRKYGHGGEVVKGETCPHRGTVRGTGAAIGGAKFTGVK